MESRVQTGRKKATGTMNSSSVTSNAQNTSPNSPSVAQKIWQIASSVMTYLTPVDEPISVSSSLVSGLSQTVVSNKGEAPTTKTKKKQRLQTPFQANVTASLMAAKKNVELDGPASVIGSFFSTTPTSWYVKMRGESAHQTKTTVEDEIKQFHDEMEQAESKLVHDKKNVEDDEILFKTVQKVRAQIVEHAARRVDLFFYLCLAVRGTFVRIEEDDTVKQHGKGSDKRGTQACHSSLFPNLKFIPTFPTETNNHRFGGLFANTSKKPFRDLRGTHFEDSLNMTVELPGIVNGFDGHLEGRFQLTEFAKDCLTILNKVSQNQLDPIAAMNEFFKVMFSFFDHLRRNYLNKPHRMDYPKTFTKVWEYEQEGTFMAANRETLTIKDEYVRLMLRLNYVERLKAIYSLEPFYDRIQEEIYQARASY